VSASDRREFVRRLAGLTALALSGCKIEPIRRLPPSTEDLPLQFPDLPVLIPDQLEDAEVTLTALTDALLDAELELLLTGALSERPSESSETVTHLLAVMRRFGLEPAGHRGGWLLPVPLDVVEPTGFTPRVDLRPESEAPASETPDSGPSDSRPPDSQAADPSDADANDTAPDPDTPRDPDAQDTDAPAAEGPPEPRLGVELASLGAFRQRGSATAHAGLLVGPIRRFETPLAPEQYAGRVALVQVPKGLDLRTREALAEVDLLFSTVREAGAIGCLLLTHADAETLDRFRLRWQRQVRRAGARPDALLIEGLLGAEGRAVVEALELRQQPWVLDVALATRQFEIESHDILGRVTGREHPDEAIVLTCSWDTPDPATAEIDTLRLLATLAAFAQLAEWSRRSTPPRYSVILLLTADAGFAAGQSVHAAWASSFGTEVSVMLALDHPTTRTLPAVSLSGHFDAALAELVRGVVAADGRDLLLAEQLAMPSLTPYLRYPSPILAIGAPAPDALGDLAADELGDQPRDLREGIHQDVRLLRNLMLALAARR
jgi:hypothetical protein